MVRAEDLRRFRDLLARQVGLATTGVSDESLATALDRRLAARGGTCEAYLATLSPAEVSALAPALTVNETYFFRNVEQFDALAQAVLPRRFLARAAERRLRVLSAGCSSGEEAYTLAMVIGAARPDPAWVVEILGVDVNPDMVRRARAGRYSPWSLRATPPALRLRWFAADGDALVLDPSVRAAARFAEHNLAADDPTLWAPGTYDVIFCRNMLMYLTPEAGHALVARMGRALAPGGFLFVGHAETGWVRGTGLAARHTHDTFYFERVPPEPAPPPAPARPVQRLPARPRPDRTGRPEPALDRALDLLRAEDFDAALALVDSLVTGTRDSLELLTVRATLLIHNGDLDGGEEAGRRLLDLDGLNAGAHYLLALCREGRGDPAGAADHHRTAAYLDPGFAVPRLRLGLLARRHGDREVARRELGHALTLLAREQPERLLLFGSGFSRQALTALCRAELIASGGLP